MGIQVTRIIYLYKAYIKIMYTKTTRNIKVTVFPSYLEQFSKPEDDCFVWSYRIQLENHGKENIQLVNRYWQITDSMGYVQEVRGAGVVGEQPVLQPGDIFEYTSGVPLNTPSGIMLGAYEMILESGEKISVEVPAFSLDSLLTKSRPN